MNAKPGKPASVDEYLLRFPSPAKRTLTRVRSAIRKALPKADEVISYSIPAYRVDGRVAIYFAGWKEHYSIYPATAPLVKAFKSELAPYEVNNKGTIRFPLDEPVPSELIARIAKYLAQEVRARAMLKAPAAKKR
jgi:uncharacterized protein YdhG (YjbR/CyaY superfamily)